MAEFVKSMSLFYGQGRSVFAETFGTNHRDYALSPREEPVSNFTDLYRDGRHGCNPRKGPVKSSIELEDLQTEDCHHKQATGPAILSVEKKRNKRLCVQIFRPI